MSKDNRKLTPASLGVVGDTGQQSAERGLGWLMKSLSELTAPSRKKILALTAKLPPESHALLMLQSLKGLAELVIQQKDSRLSLLAVGDDPERLLGDEIRQPLLDTIERIRDICHKIHTAVAIRASEGYPAWDFERGCPVGGSPDPVEYATDDLLRFVLNGMEDSDGDI